MFAMVTSAAVDGLEGRLIAVEADVSDGMPLFTMVGYLASEVKEAKDRVRTALRNIGVRIPPKRITVNLSPADLRKEGTAYDLPVALSVMAAAGLVPGSELENLLVAGELGLDGAVNPVRGILPMVMEARRQGISRCLLSTANMEEAEVIEGMQVIPVDNLEEAVSFSRGWQEEEIVAHRCKKRERWQEVQAVEGTRTACTDGEGGAYLLPKLDFSQVRGQESAKRLALIGAAGGHNIFIL